VREARDEGYDEAVRCGWTGDDIDSSYEHGYRNGYAAALGAPQTFLGSEPATRPADCPALP
jgi:hypothetical protein